MNPSLVLRGIDPQVHGDDGDPELLRQEDRGERCPRAQVQDPPARRDRHDLGEGLDEPQWVGAHLVLEDPGRVVPCRARVAFQGETIERVGVRHGRSSMARVSRVVPRRKGARYPWGPGSAACAERYRQLVFLEDGHRPCQPYLSGVRETVHPRSVLIAQRMRGTEAIPRRGEDMRPRITVLTIGVDDLEVSVRFYRDGLGLATEGIVGTEFEHGAAARPTSPSATTSVAGRPWTRC